MLNNLSNLSCFIPQEFISAELFYECYQQALKQNLFIGILGIFLTFSVILANIFIIILLGCLKEKTTKEKVNIFDKILIGHALVDLCTGI